MNAPSPVSGDDREALAKVISNFQACGSCAGAPPYCGACLEETDAILAAGFTRTPAVQVDAAKVHAAVSEVAIYGGMDALDDEQLEGVIAGITDGVLAALRSPVGDSEQEWTDPQPYIGTTTGARYAESDQRGEGRVIRRTGARDPEYTVYRPRTREQFDAAERDAEYYFGTEDRSPVGEGH